MKKVMFCVACLLGTIGVFAQKANLTSQEKLEKRVERMDKKLDLTDDQESTVLSIMSSSNEQIEALKNQSSSYKAMQAEIEAAKANYSGEELKKEMRNIKKSYKDAADMPDKEEIKLIRENAEQEVLAILDEEQTQKFVEMKEKMDNKKGRKGKKGKKGKRG